MLMSSIIFNNNLLIGLTLMSTIDAFPQFTKEDESYEETDDIDNAYDEEKIVVVTIAKQKPPSTTSTTTEKSTVLRNSANIFEITPIDSSNNGASGNVQKLMITIPNNADGTGGGTIELEIPMEAMSHNESGNVDREHTGSNILTMDNQNVKNIEGAILEALHFAQKMGGMNMKTKTNSNGTETFELDIGNFQTNTASNIATKGKESRNATSATAPITPPLEQSLPPGPITDFIMSQIKNGQKLMSGKLKPADFLVSAFEALECVVGYWCNDDDE